jgi:hypothetical protein
LHVLFFIQEVKRPWQVYINGPGVCNLSEEMIRILEHLRVYVERVSVKDATQIYVSTGYLAEFGGWVMMVSVTDLEIHLVWILLEDLRKELKLEGHDNPITQAALGNPRIRSAIRCLQLRFWKEFLDRLRNNKDENSVKVLMSRERVNRALSTLSKSRREPEWDEAKLVCMKSGRKAQKHQSDNTRINTLTGRTLNAIEQRVLSILGGPIEIRHLERTKPVSTTLRRTSFGTKPMERADIISIQFNRFSHADL